jgi:DNA-binding transcriptional regulator YhcF (GntR family)
MATSPASADPAAIQVSDDGSATWSYDYRDGAVATGWDAPMARGGSRAGRGRRRRGDDDGGHVSGIGLASGGAVVTSTMSPAGQARRAGAPQVPAAPGRDGFTAGLDLIRAQVRGRDGGSREEARRRSSGRAVELAAGRFSVPGAADVPGVRMVIGVDGDPRAWVKVANALLDRIVSGAVRAGSRVPPVTSLDLESPVAPGVTARAFRMLADEGVLCWMPGRGYYVRTRFTVAVSDRPRQDGGLRAVLPGGGPRHA